MSDQDTPPPDHAGVEDHIQKMSRHRSFTGWLARQVRRGDTVGWFARVAIREAQFLSLYSEREWRDYINDQLELQAADPDAWPSDLVLTINNAPDAFGEAAAEYREYRAGRNITYSTRARVMERDGFRCRRCGVGPDRERLVVDHIVPVADGGGRDESNLQTLCEPCNIGKGARPPHPHDLGGRE
jgi:hypothetical protein